VKRRRLDEGVLNLALRTERWGDEEVITQTEIEAEGINGFCTFPVRKRSRGKPVENQRLNFLAFAHRLY
jgi:hypothetical protein